MPWLQTGATQYHVQLGHPDKGRVIKGLPVCNDCDIEALDLLNGLTLQVVINRPLRGMTCMFVCMKSSFSSEATL